MRSITKTLGLNWDFTKLIEWSKLILVTGTTQVVVQVLGFVSGIVIIRLLPTHEYALYTMANTMLGTMTMLADSGISNGIMAEGGKVWQDKKKLGSVLATGLRLRMKFGLTSLAVTTPLLVYLLYDNGASWISIVLIIIGIVPAFLASLSDSFLEIAPKLHQDIKPLQKNVMEVGIGRFLLSVLLLFVFPFTFVALIANGLPRIYGNIKLRKISSRFACEAETPDPIIQKRIMHSVKRTLPIVVYHCISGQISIWIISLLGTAALVAQLGALGRISMIFTLVSILFSTLVVPRFARLALPENDLLKPFLLLQAAGIIIGILLVISVWLFSNQILWVFGENYYGLNNELFLFGIVGSMGLLNGICSQLVISRGWYLKPYILIGMHFLGTFIFIAFFDPSTLINNLYYGIAASLAGYFLIFVYGLNRIFSSRVIYS